MRAPCDNVRDLPPEMLLEVVKRLDSASVVSFYKSGGIGHWELSKVRTVWLEKYNAEVSPDCVTVSIHDLPLEMLQKVIKYVDSATFANLNHWEMMEFAKMWLKEYGIEVGEDFPADNMKSVLVHITAEAKPKTAALSIPLTYVKYLPSEILRELTHYVDRASFAIFYKSGKLSHLKKSEVRKIWMKKYHVERHRKAHIDLPGGVLSWHYG